MERCFANVTQHGTTIKTEKDNVNKIDYYQSIRYKKINTNQSLKILVSTKYTKHSGKCDCPYISEHNFKTESAMFQK